MGLGCSVFRPFWLNLLYSLISFSLSLKYTISMKYKSQNECLPPLSEYITLILDKVFQLTIIVLSQKLRILKYTYCM